MSCNQLKDTSKVKIGALNRGDQGPVQRVVVSCNQLEDASKVKVGALNRGDQGPVQRERLCPATNSRMPLRLRLVH